MWSIPRAISEPRKERVFDQQGPADPQARVELIKELYRTYLRREEQQADVDTYLMRMNEGQQFRQILAALIGSNAYLNRLLR